MDYPEPHEGVQGVTRTRDDLLSLEGPAIARRMIVMDIAESLFKASLAGPVRPLSGEPSLFDQVSKPQIGDLVIERTTAFIRDPAQRARGFGILLGRRIEWACTKEQWTERCEEEAAACREHGDEEGALAALAEERLTDHAWYIQYGSDAADICRWTNCMFYRVPTGLLHHTKEQQP